jgi:hypothetical protein
LLVLIGGIKVMNARPEHAMVAAIVPPATALNTGPYDAARAKERWTRLAAGSPTALASERFMLTIDLLFPLFKGVAFGVGLWFSARGLGYAGLATFLVPVFLMMAADWTENSIQLQQLSRFEASGEVSARWITLASAATCLKLVLVSGLALMNLGAGLRLAFFPPQT